MDKDKDLFIEIDDKGNYVSGPLTRRNLIDARYVDPDKSKYYEPFFRSCFYGSGYYPYAEKVCDEIRKINGVWTDVFVARGFRPSEKYAKIEAAKKQFQEDWGFKSWRWVEERCSYMAPVDPPADPAPPDKKYIWNEIEKNWVLVDKTDIRKFIK